MVTMAVNLEEYFKQFKNTEINKNHKGMRRNAHGIHFYNYTSRMLSLIDHEELFVFK